MVSFESIWTYFFNPLTDALGLSGSPVKTFAFFSVATAITLWGLKPNAMFDQGTPRELGMLGDVKGKTPIPWYVASGLTGTFAALFF